MPDISRIKIIEDVYDVKDDEVRDILNVLLSGQKLNIEDSSEDLPSQ